MNILILGGGGREHSLAWAVAQNPKCDELFVAPGNAGTINIGRNIDLSVNDFEGIKALALEEGINMIIVGPEDPLVNGIYDYFQNDILLNEISFKAKRESSKSFKGFF